MFIHYPPFLASIQEQPHYDNVDEPGRSRLLALVAKMKAEALFSGHVHHFFYNRHKQTDMYCLPSTTFTRHDFSELFAITPAEDAEFGRDDPAKLGYALVDVYADKHIVRIVNTLGAKTSDGLDNNISRPLTSLHPRDGVAPPIAVQLRHTWSEVRALPTNGPLDDFNRKKARNDYPILATWQIGITWLRVPLEDLEDEQARIRMLALRNMGQRFVVMKFGVPDDQTIKLVDRHADLVSALEVIMPPDRTTAATDAFLEIRDELNIPVYLGYMESSADLSSADAKYFAHTTTFGYRISEPAHTEVLLNKQSALIAASDGVLFHIPSSENILPQIAEIDSLSKKINKSVMVHVMNAKQHPASAEFCEHFVANRTATACLGALSLSNGLVVLDTLVDIDRGDFPRTGLIDRRGNRNLAGQYLQTLLSVLAVNVEMDRVVVGEIKETDAYTRVSFQQQSVSYQLYLVNSSEAVITGESSDNFSKAVRCIDIETGKDIINRSALPTGKSLLVE